MNTSLNDLAGSLVKMAAVQPAQPAIVDRPMTPPPQYETHSHKPKPVIDIEPYPCTHCGVTVEFSGCTFCFYPPCHAPFHLPGTGCAKEDMVFVVDTALLYCRQACAQFDQANNHTRLDRVQPVPSSTREAHGPKEDVVNIESDIHQSRTVGEAAPAAGVVL